MQYVISPKGYCTENVKEQRTAMLDIYHFLNVYMKSDPHLIITDKQRIQVPL